MEKYGKNGRFSGRLWPDWGNTAWAAMAELGSIGLIRLLVTQRYDTRCYIVLRPPSVFNDVRVSMNFTRVSTHFTFSLLTKCFQADRLFFFLQFPAKFTGRSKYVLFQVAYSKAN